MERTFDSSDANILNIKRQFVAYINLMKSNIGYERIIERMEDLKSMLYFLKVSVIKNKEKVIAEYNKILICFTSKPQWATILSCLDSAEKIFLECIGALLSILNSEMVTCLNKVNTSDTSLYKRFTDLIIDYFIFQPEQESLTYVDLMVNIKKLFETFNIFLNSFTIQLFKKYACEGSDEFICQKIKVREFFEEVFGKPLNFKFLFKANRVFARFPDRKDSHSNTQLLFTCTDFDKSFLPKENSLVDKTFEITTAGMKSKNLRCDGFVTIGRSPLADFVLPYEDKKVDLLAFAMYFDGEIWHMMDCSKKTNVFIQMTPQKPYLLKPGLIISPVGMVHIWIKNIEQNYDNEEYYDDNIKIHSSLYYEYINGPLSNSFGDKVKVCSTLTRTPNEFKSEYFFGKGGAGNAIDCLIDCNGFASGKHFSFTYTNNMNWNCTDLSSKNGTYYMMKNYDQYIEKSPSKIIPLFYSSKETIKNENGEEQKIQLDDKTITIKISNYAFYIRQDI
ncbi:hypothetical protein SteCoe_30871 [Stentor coeruleus]|uniref:FHA domain-containing protein n=1 Tax=Stentor coeruleus TaxID=5963 RepID=A0A1R2B2W4_9CILI|nr:hypothetical protein SteCoe_30871 [Stentor coeruleus]